MTSGYDSWDTIAIVIIFDILHDDFDTTTTNLLKSSDKTIDQIQSILQSKEVKNLSKQSNGAIEDIAIVVKDSRKSKTIIEPVTNDSKCFNCHRVGY